MSDIWEENTLNPKVNSVKLRKMYEQIELEAFAFGFK